MHKPFQILLRVIAILGLLVYLYFLFTRQPVPKWTLYVFAGSMLLVLALNFFQNQKSRK